MYVIYPADDLFQLLLEENPAVDRGNSCPGPLLRHLSDPQLFLPPIPPSPVPPPRNKEVKRSSSFKGFLTRKTHPVLNPKPPRPAFVPIHEEEDQEGDDDFIHFRGKNTTGLQITLRKLKLFSDEEGTSPSPATPATPYQTLGGLTPTPTPPSTTSTNSNGGFTFVKNRSVSPCPQGGMAAAGGNHLTGPTIEANSIKELAHPTLNESLKGQNGLSFKLVRIVSDFTQQLSQLHEQHSVDLQLLVENFRKRNSELRKERAPCSSSLFQVWETLLQEVEIDSQAHSDISGSLGRQVARPLLEKTFCRKIQSRKIFAHRENFETLLVKAEASLSNSYREYCEACSHHSEQGTNSSLAIYFEKHNAYVQQLRATNAMLKEYNGETLPNLLQELEEIYVDLCNVVSESVLHGAEIVSSRTSETTRRYEALVSVCRAVSGIGDLREFARSLLVPAPPNQRHAFTLPVNLNDGEGGPQDMVLLKDEVVHDRLTASSTRTRQDNVKKEMLALEGEIRQIHDSLETLLRMQQRSVDSNLFNKANELQEEISMKKFDLRAALLHMASLKAQRELFGGQSGARNDAMGSVIDLTPSKGDRKMSAAVGAGAGGTGMKSKWLKAFRSLKPPAGSGPSTPTPKDANMDKKNGKDKESKNNEPFQIIENHIFQEYTYKKVTPCDICSQILRGHTRQGVRCRLCKINVHADCQEKVGKCQPKTRLLRRQKSTSELETRLSQLTEPPDEEALAQLAQKGDEPDLIYQVLKQATDLKKPGNGFHGSSGTLQGEPVPSSSRRSNPSVNVAGLGSGGSSTPGSVAQQIISAQSSSSGLRSFFPGKKGGLRRDSYVSRKSVSADCDATPPPPMFPLQPSRAISLPTTQTPHSPRRRKLDLRMKSFSLDSPESTEHAQRRRYAAVGSQSTSHSQYSIGDDEDGERRGRRMRMGGGSAGNLRNSAEMLRPAASASFFAPSSPVHNRRALLSARNVRMSSVELPDENDKSLSSASTSPCPSPKPHRLLPTNLYVVLYMFKARHPDELDLKAGNKVTVTDTTDPDWWQGKCLGLVGYFPSKYVTKLHPGEKPLQVTHNLQVTDGAENGLKLLRDQIVIQVGEELDGMVTIRNGENKQGVCPLKYLQEV